MAKRSEPFNNPFREARKALQDQVRARGPTPAAKPEPREPEPLPEPDPAELFAAHVGPVRALGDPRGRVPPPAPDKPVTSRFAPEEEEAYEALVALVEGRTRFDIADTDEFIRGGLEGLDRRILRKLERGEFTHRRFLDLHGMTREAAKEAVEGFVVAAREAGERCVLIVHGRGRNSKDKIPVLKEALRSWLARGRVGKIVLAFCTARPHDGGAGAMYVLLRR